MLDFLFEPLFKIETCINGSCYVEPSSAMTSPISVIILGLGMLGMFGCFSLYYRMKEKKEKALR
jgi:hypothetical protein